MSTRAMQASTAGGYIPQAAALTGTQEGSSFWEAALAADGDEDDYEDDYEDESELFEEDEDGSDVDVEDIATLMRDLAAGLEGGQAESAVQSTWRHVYTSRQLPPLTLGPVTVKKAPGKGRGLFTTAAAAPGNLLLTAMPLALLYCEEGTTPEMEELADALAAAASVYDLYDLLSLCVDQLPKPASGKATRSSSSSSSAGAPPVETEALATCARLVGAIAPGSTAHVDLTTEYMVRSEMKFGEDHQEAADASRMCAAAHTTRYGPCSPRLLELIIDTRAGLAALI
eukprot:gene13191-13322_t